ncbi:MAG TPA: hypothetical protein VGX48_15300 [Pyrinomonadaceae bacterium]|jgi:hypothetical protein|nr:hypothetical protein [Pyrinomonadaceae bacterium]
MLPVRFAALSLALLLVPASAAAQRKKRAPARQQQQSAAKERKQADEDLKKLQAQLVEATEDYKKSLRELLALREADERTRLAELEKVKKLNAEGLLSRRDVEKSEGEVAASRARSQEVRTRLTEADEFLAEALAEPEVAEAPAPVVAAKRTPPVQSRSGYLRYAGFADWRLSDSGRVQGFFSSRFGRQLPVSAFGQTDLHNRMNFDHRNSMDVALHPDSAEGRALLEYLRSQGIPFLAFRGAISGTATGPHIHVGRPSHRIR